MTKKVLDRLVRFVLDLLFPPRCVFCGEIVPPGTQVCRDCAETIAPSGSVRYLALPGSDKQIPCAALYPYEGKVRSSILRYKFHGQRQNADYYAEGLVPLVKLAFPDAGFSLVTWVPLSDQRKKERGYDQAELIAKKLAEAMRLPCAPCLRKAKANRVQHFLSREERAGNVRGVYASNGREISGKNVLLLDDIVTTGATLAECAAVLVRCGAAAVFCAAVAHAEPEHVEKSSSL
jgi:ComF family protein